VEKIIIRGEIISINGKKNRVRQKREGEKVLIKFSGKEEKGEKRPEVQKKESRSGLVGEEQNGWE